MSTYGTIGSATYAISLSGIDEMMSSLPDNTANQINALSSRNVVYTLYQQILNVSASNLVFTYSNPNPTLVTVGGIIKGSTFSNESLTGILNQMFYPYQPPLVSLSIVNNSFLEYGYPNTGANPVCSLSVNITQQTDNIVASNINSSQLGGNLTPNPTFPANNFGSSQTTQYAGVQITQNMTTTYTAYVNDGTSTQSSSVQATWFFPRFYGTIDLGKGPDYNVSSNPSDWSGIVASFSQNGWQGLWQRSGVVKSSTKLSTVTIGNGTHIYFAWPVSDFGSGTGVPKFTIGGFESNVFSNISQYVNITNQYGYGVSCSIWISNTKQNSITINLQ
jgi:hypothetical protein